MSRPRTRRAHVRVRILALVAVAVWLWSVLPARALDIGGSIRLFWTNSESFGISSQTTDQQLRLGLRQELTPYLFVTLNHSHLELESRTEDSDPSTRRLRQPQLRFIYSRPKLSANLGYSYRIFDGTSGLEDFEAQGIDAQLAWQARPSLSFNLTLRNDVNETDVGALGRETETRVAQAAVRFDRTLWNGMYQYSHIELENALTALTAQEDRHDLRLNAGRSFFDDRLDLALQGLFGYADRSQDIGEGADLADPVPAVQGLFAIEVNPELAELEPVPGLIDGDFVNPVSPPIDIGAANTFRNLGLDLGVTRPITRLEIAVDQPSGPGVVWEVYRSRDNLFWETVPGVQSLYDPDLLRYRLRFPETEDRFFKAVNVSVNSAPRVLVTEIRALLDLTDAVGEERFRTDLYRIDASAGYEFSSRVRAGLNVGSRNDEATVAGLVRQDYQVDYANAGLDVAFTDSLAFGLGYRWAETVEVRGETSSLDRTTSNADASLTWTPLRTVRMVLAASNRDEYERNELLQSTQSSRLGASLQLLDELRVSSYLDYSRVDDPFIDSTRDSWAGTVDFRANPRRRWSLRGGYSHRLNESLTSEDLLRTTALWLGTDWSPGYFLTVTGEWRLDDSNSLQSLRQNYGLVYSPGPKLAITASWDELDSDSGRLTGGSHLSASYRLYRRVVLFGTLSRSRTRQSGELTSEINTAQFGLTIEF